MNKDDERHDLLIAAALVSGQPQQIGPAIECLAGDLPTRSSMARQRGMQEEEHAQRVRAVP